MVQEYELKVACRKKISEIIIVGTFERGKNCHIYNMKFSIFPLFITILLYNKSPKNSMRIHKKNPNHHSEKIIKECRRILCLEKTKIRKDIKSPWFFNSYFVHNKFEYNNQFQCSPSCPLMLFSCVKYFLINQSLYYCGIL